MKVHFSFSLGPFLAYLFGIAIFFFYAVGQQQVGAHNCPLEQIRSLENEMLMDNAKIARRFAHSDSAKFLGDHIAVVVLKEFGKGQNRGAFLDDFVDQPPTPPTTPTTSTSEITTSSSSDIPTTTKTTMAYGFAITMAPEPDYDPFEGRNQIHLWSWDTQQFVAASGEAGGLPVLANRDKATPETIFTVVRVDNGNTTYSFRAHNNKFVNENDGVLFAEKEDNNARSTHFIMESVGNDNIALKSKSANKYVYPNRAKGYFNHLVAESDAHQGMDNWREMFRVYAVGQIHR